MNIASRGRLGHRIAGFTLLELIVSLLLLALISAVLYGSLTLAADSWNKGEEKAEQTRQMRLASQFLRQTLATAYPLHLNGAGESLFPFLGEDNWVMFPAVLTPRAGGGLYYFRLGLAPHEDHSQLILARVIPQYDSTQPPNFDNAEVSVLADDVSLLKFRYFGSVYQNGPDPSTPIWRDRWDDRKQWPTLIRVDVTPRRGPAWPPVIIELRLGAQTICDEIRRAHNMCDAI